MSIFSLLRHGGHARSEKKKKKKKTIMHRFLQMDKSIPLKPTGQPDLLFSLLPLPTALCPSPVIDRADQRVAVSSALCPFRCLSVGVDRFFSSLSLFRDFSFLFHFFFFFLNPTLTSQTHCLGRVWGIFLISFVSLLCLLTYKL